MKMHICLLSLFWVLFSSCQRDNVHNDFIDLERIIRSTRSGELSQIADSISYIFLETNDNCLLPNNNSIIHIDFDDVFIRGGNYIYRFSRNGSFMNRIGNIGMGPEEYPNLQDVAIDSFNKCLLLLIPSGALYFYDYNGSFIKKIQLKNEVKRIKNISTDKRFICETRDYSNGYSTSITEYNYDGEIIHEVLVEKDELKLSRSLHTVSIMYQTAGAAKFKSLYNDTIYQYKKNRLSKYKVLSLGKYSPARDVIEDVNKKGQLLTQYAQIVDIIESEKYFFLLIIMNQNIYGSVLNKTTRKLIFNKKIENPKYGGGVPNNINNKGNFWPMLAVSDNKLAQIIHPDNIQVNDVSADSNPVIQIISLKD